MAGSCQIDDTIDIKSADVDKTGQVFALFFKYILYNGKQYLIGFFFETNQVFMKYCPFQIVMSYILFDKMK